MGAVNFKVSGQGEHAREVFENLVEEATYERGHDSYNGTISTCSYTGCKTVAKEYSKKAEKEADKIIERDDYGRKWEAKALDLGVIEYQIISIKKITPVVKKKAEYKQKYVVVKNNYPTEVIVSSYDDKKSADTDAMKRSLKEYNGDCSYYVAKRPVNINKGNDMVTEFEVKIVTRKSKPTKIPEGAIVKEIHKYVFYGLAAS